MRAGDAPIDVDGLVVRGVGNIVARAVGWVVDVRRQHPGSYPVFVLADVIPLDTFIEAGATTLDGGMSLYIGFHLNFLHPGG